MLLQTLLLVSVKQFRVSLLGSLVLSSVRASAADDEVWRLVKRCLKLNLVKDGCHGYLYRFGFAASMQLNSSSTVATVPTQNELFNSF